MILPDTLMCEKHRQKQRMKFGMEKIIAMLTENV